MARIVPTSEKWTVRKCRPRIQPKHTNKLIPMKLVKVISLGLTALFLGACASKPSQSTTVPTSTVVVPAK